jgi:hypothetical protein
MITDTLITLYTYTIGFILHNLPTVTELPELLTASIDIIYGNIKALVFYIPPMGTVITTFGIILAIEFGVFTYAVISKHILKHG